MGQAISQPAFTRVVLQRSSRHGGGSRRSYFLSLLISGLFITGLAIWLWPQGAASHALVLWLHLAAGGVLAGLLLPWLWTHVPRGLCTSQRRVFTQSSWVVLGFWSVLLVSGMVAALPAIIWGVGLVWFPPREISDGLSFVHFWSSWGAVAGLGLHLAQRHWVWGAQ
ncbi:hypothetical protein RYZ20_07785 [Thioclava sp. A2]|uniref:hypothetical protein n=1 Tax=Thioclava sp. FCG-A2 TaxID=3080562 RepID=UPI00295408D1|nr:hypothetical protein [Thioclava sp. A2]MDV7270800.1 hypothetical protein [Thioclava sp. A2]